MSDSENFAVTIVKHVTRPQIKLEPGKQYFLEIEEPIFKADAITATRARKSADGTDAGGRKMEPPELVNVKDLQHDNRPSVIIVNSVLGSELRKHYPSDAYVGKSFCIQKNQLQGKAYATFDIAEIRVTGQTAPATQPAKSTGKK